MMNKLTAFQKLQKIFIGGGNNANINRYSINSDDDVILRTKDKSEYERALLQHQQQSFLSKQWIKAQYNLSNDSLQSLNETKLMFREADMMDLFPEIGTALDIVAEECTFSNDEGNVINITSGSERIKSILEDLFINRLSINITLPMICRGTCKYGNDFMLLNINAKEGVLGWKELPVYEMERYENGMNNPYSGAFVNTNNINPNEETSTKFVWVGKDTYIGYRDWQIAHFRLIYNSIFLPYGVSFLNKARRHFRLLSMMEDSMLVYRLERAVERRVFKINVGAIDEKDVPAYVQSIANEFKRTPIVDPMTGQIDLRKNILANTEDFFIPVRDDNASNPIETLPAAQNLTAIDDIKFIQNKVFTALRVPKSFLNFEEAQGDGKNLSLLDVRFAKTVNRIQQSLIMELNKIAIIHLILLGFTDELTNFSITMNNPSSQAEMLEIENMAKKITAAKDAVTDGGNGIPIMSLTRAWKKIFKWSDKEISDNLEELRLEKALAAELEKTSQIIKRTGIFDPVDNVYGETDADYSDTSEEGGGDGQMNGSSGTVGGNLDFGDEFSSDGGGEDASDMEDLNGEEGEMDMDNAAQEDNQAEQNESIARGCMKKLLTENLKKQKALNSKIKKRTLYYQNLLNKKIASESAEKNKINKVEQTKLYNKNFVINEELNSMSKMLTELYKENN